MTRNVALLASILAILAVALLLASVVSGAIRHSQGLSASFVVVEGKSEASVDRVLEMMVSDLNGDGVINQDDLNGVVKSLASSPGDDSSADLNGDGTVDVSDLALVGMYYGRSVDQ